jgi:hypothetical protein
MNNIEFFKEIFNNVSKGKLSSLSDVKYYKRWATYLQPQRNSIADHLPWINFPAIDFLEKHLNSSDKVFEYGGGGSTLFFLDRVKEVVTVEHNPEWFQILQKTVIVENNKKWDGNLLVAEPTSNYQSLKSSNPDDYYSADPNYSKMSFFKYASYIDKFPDGYFDVVLVDGRARPSCIKHAVNKIKKDGILVLDNAERNYYMQETGPYMRNFKMIMDRFSPLPYLKHFTQTNIWQKI